MISHMIQIVLTTVFKHMRIMGTIAVPVLPPPGRKNPVFELVRAGQMIGDRMGDFGVGYPAMVPAALGPTGVDGMVFPIFAL